MLVNTIVYIILALIAIGIALALFISFKFRKESYDERQLLARNAACRTAFMILICYCIVCGLLSVFNIAWADTAYQMLIGITVSLTVFMVKCIINDASLNFLGKHKWGYIINCFFYGSLMICRSIFQISRGTPIIKNGEITGSTFFIIISVCYLALGVVSAVKAYSDSKHAEE